MKPINTLLVLYLFILKSFGQTTYSGFIDNFPIELVTDIYSDDDVNAFYVYSKFDGPIPINGTLKKGELTLFEKDKMGKNKAQFSFKNYDPTNLNLEGIWKEINSTKEQKVTLHKTSDINSGENIEWKNKELLQPISLPDKYFKLIISKDKESFYAGVVGIKIFEKKTDKLIQQIDIECQLWGLNNISVEDYNFDGFLDFSVFEQSYAGSNTSSIYFLYNPKTKTFFNSNFEGTSLEFDSKKKRIYEHNQCCAGRSIENAEYKIVNNKMVLIKKTCLEYDETKDDYKKVKCE